VIFLGVDPGLSGSLAAIDHHGRLLYLADLPTVAIPGDGTVKRRLHGARLVRQIREAVPADECALAYVEDVQVWNAGAGASTLAAMYATKMVILAAFDCFESRIEVRMVVPAVWKRHFGLKKPARPSWTKSQISAEFKSMSRACAAGLFPDADLRLAKSDGRAEALLIAYYAREVWKTEGEVFDAPIAPPPPRQPTAKELRQQEIDARIPLQ
jgi:Holliday junction resolvasome RuvABC endonuclease subunit